MFPSLQHGQGHHHFSRTPLPPVVRLTQALAGPEAMGVTPLTPGDISDPLPIHTTGLIRNYRYHNTTVCR